ncbi:MAG: tetratricopeptide repeat protein [Chloroflexota bacterium]|nr:tetratricopeptide repeat protein [Chloroflexota bacterium]
MDREELRALLRDKITIAGDGNIVGNDNTVSVVKQTAGDYAVQIGQINVILSPSELRQLLVPTEALASHLQRRDFAESSLTPKTLAPYLRVIESQEEVLSGYKGALENRMKCELDKAADLINAHQLTKARVILERLRDEEFSSVSNIDGIGSGLQESLYRLLGLCHLRLGDFDAAFNNLEIAESIIGETEQLDKVMLEYHIAIKDHDAATQIAHKLLDTDPTSIEAKNALAVIQLRAGNFASVVKSYKKLPHADEDPSAQSILFFAYMQLRELSLALQKAQRFFDLEPELPQAHETLGNAYLAMAHAPAQGQLETQAEWLRAIIDKKSLRRAIDSYQKAQTLYDGLEQPYFSEALRINLASALVSDGRLLEALGSINENLGNVHEPSIENFELKAQIEERLGKTDCALDTCLSALQLFPDDSGLMVNIGGLYLNKGEPKKARKWLHQAKANYIDSKELAFIQIVCSKTYFIQNDRAGAWVCLQSIPTVEMESAGSYLAFGDYFSYFKNYSEAEHYYQKALSQEPNNLGLLNKVVGFYRELRQFENALMYARKFAELADTPIAYINYAQLLGEADKPSEALSALQTAKERGLDSAYKPLEAMCRQRLRQFPEAVKLYEEVLQDTPDDFVATYNLALCYSRLGQRTKAIQTFTVAEGLRPDEVQVHTAMAQLYQVEGQRAKAYDYARRALEYASDNPDIYLFFFGVAHFCGYEEEAAKVLMQVPKRFPEYQNLKVLPEEKAKEIIESSRKGYDQVKRFYQSGNLPLVLVAKWLNKPVPLLWQLFSQDTDVKMLCALGSFEEQRHSYSIAVQASQVVVDYTALTTLYYLELLDLPARLFETAYLSQSTFDRIQEDILYLTQSVSGSRADRLESIRQIVYQHPKFRRQTEWLEASLILDAQQQENIKPYIEQDVLLAKQHNALYLSDDLQVFASVEQVLSDKVTTTKGLLDYLMQRGKLKRTDYDAACHYLKGTYRLGDFGVDDIDRFRCIVVSYITLEVLFDTGLFDLVLDEFDAVYVSQPTLFLLNQAIGEIKFYRRQLKAVTDIESAVRSNESYTIQAVTFPEDKLKLSVAEATDKDFLETFALAKELRLPLWADDLASRRLAATNEAGPIEAFDTRIALDMALNKGQVTHDKLGDSILALLKWNYYFVHINSSIIHWSIEQRNFHPNEDTDLLLTSLDSSIDNAYQELFALSGQEEVDPDRLERQISLFSSNVHVYADLLLSLWYNLPAKNKYARSGWAATIFERIDGIIPDLYFGVSYLVLICLTRMLQGFDDERLDHFIVFCTSPFTLPSSDSVDEIIQTLLVWLYNQGNYDEGNVRTAARLLNNLRAAQYFRVMHVFRRWAPNEFSKAIRAVRVN